jgi:hypothetical protein
MPGGFQLDGVTDENVRPKETSSSCALCYVNFNVTIPPLNNSHHYFIIIITTIAISHHCLFEEAPPFTLVCELMPS